MSARQRSRAQAAEQAQQRREEYYGSAKKARQMARRQRLPGLPAVGGVSQGLGLQRPDALLVGSLKVEDPGAFTALLARGLGRHRAFGFGMLRVGSAV